jgi:hypothetical protein
VDFSKLKLEVYDLLGLIVPGLIAICEGWILIHGWHTFLAAIGQMSGTALTLLLLFAFGAGNVVQELGDFIIKLTKGHRYFRVSRDHFWLTSEAEIVKDAIKKEIGHHITSVDAAFDFCLTKLKDRFNKRDLFVATSDLCRSSVVLAILAFAPALRVAFCDVRPLSHSYEAAAILGATLLSISLLMWRRMVRFRELSEITVFRAYLALASGVDTQSL